MEPPSEYQSPRRQPWDGSHRHHPPPPPQTAVHAPRRDVVGGGGGEEEMRPSISRGRGPIRRREGEGGALDDDDDDVVNRSTIPSQSKSNTPRRKGNPQSSSPSIEGVGRRSSPSMPHSSSHSSTNDNGGCISLGSDGTVTTATGGGGPPLTPLSTLSTILSTHTAHERTALMLFRQSHALHLHAVERSSAAMEKLRLAQAEVEHADTALEFAREELDGASSRKTSAQDALRTIRKRVRKLSVNLVNRKVRLVGLKKNAQWNGRHGTIIKLVTDGVDAGRWKVRLDTEWRGRDADGANMMQNDDRGGGGGDDDDDDDDDVDRGGGGRSSTTNTVVAKAENLELVDGRGDIILEGVMGGLYSSRSRSASSTREPRSSSRDDQYAQNHQRVGGGTPHGRSRDPSINARRNDPGGAEYEPQQQQQQRQRSASRSTSTSSKRKSRRKHDPWNDRRTTTTGPRRNDPVAVTPESRGSARSPRRNIVPAEYYKTEGGQYRETPSPPDRMHPQNRHGARQAMHASQQQQRQVSSPPRQSSVRHHQPNQSAGKRPNATRYPSRNLSPSRVISPIQRSRSNDSERISSAFSRMLLSPVSFTPVSFNPEPSESFQRNSDSFEQWTQRGDNDFQDHNQGRQQHQQVRQNQWQHANGSSGDVISTAGSLFNQVTLMKNDEEIVNNYNEWEEYALDPQLQTYPSPRENATTYSTTADGHNLPHIVVLPVDEDDQGNPYLSPGYTSSSPPHCVGVQNAGFSHVNGVYLLAYPEDENGNAIVEDEGVSDLPPLYFKDGPPTLLSDDRYYDMCILRINCPDSVDHVIWFLARVDVNPDCLDVKFSDCYYYCRMLRTDDGCGGEREGGCLSPPSRGWNLPKLPKGVEMLSIAKSRSFSPALSSKNGPPSGGGQHGLGILPRPHTASGHQ